MFDQINTWLGEQKYSINIKISYGPQVFEHYFQKFHHMKHFYSNFFFLTEWIIKKHYIMYI